ncbi:lysylphosphatidylglycerol synthase transmembrane domain-containing protein [soil metagenome]
MNKKNLSILKYIFFLGIGFFLVWWQFDKMTGEEKNEFAESLKNADYLIIIPVIIMSLLSHISRSIRWKLLMEPMGYAPRLSTTFYSVMIGYLVNTFLPRAGEVVRCSLLGKKEKIPFNKLVGTVLLERTFDLFCYLLLIIITILIQVRFVTGFIKEKISSVSESTAGSSIPIKIIFILFSLIAGIVLVRFIFRRYAHHHYIISIKGFHIGLMEGFKTIIHLKKRTQFISHTIFIWSMYVLQIYIGFYALPATTGLSLVHACSVLSLATLAMIVSPGGIGAFPLAVQEILSLYKIENVSFGWLIWGTSTAIVIVAGLICFGLYMYQKIEKNEIQPATGK